MQGVTLIQCHINLYSALTVVKLKLVKGLVISKQTVVMHRWENTLAKISGTVGNLRPPCLRLPLIFVFTNITTEERALSPKLICLRKIAHTLLTIWFICCFFTLLVVVQKVIQTTLPTSYVYLQSTMFTIFYQIITMFHD